MKFTNNQIFHIYNQGNNRERIFFNDSNYLYFLTKVRTYLLPFGKMINYCLMPNHFHILFYLEQLKVEINGKNMACNQAIGFMLMSYTKAINIQQHRSGSLFRSKTKINDPWREGFITISKIFEDNSFEKSDFIQNCFDYIHLNPVSAGMVKLPEEWMYSSAMDYKGLRNGTMCDKNWVIETFGINT